MSDNNAIDYRFEGINENERPELSCLVDMYVNRKFVDFYEDFADKITRFQDYYDFALGTPYISNVRELSRRSKEIKKDYLTFSKGVADWNSFIAPNEKHICWNPVPVEFSNFVNHYADVCIIAKQMCQHINSILFTADWER